MSDQAPVSDPDSQPQLGQLPPPEPLTRLGKTSQCPICCGKVHSEAYRCTKCRSFFCYHCRAHLGPQDTILQCGNRDCNYYGKWICSICDPAGKKDEAPLEYIEPIDGYWPLWLIVSIIISLLMVWYTTWAAALIVFVGLYAGLGYILQQLDINIFGKARQVVMPRSSEVHLCICCKQPAKKVTTRSKAV